MNSKVTLLLQLIFFWSLIPAADANDTSYPQIYDFRHAELALAWLNTPKQETLEQLAHSAAAEHLKRHSDKTGYYPADYTPMQITQDLLSVNRLTRQSQEATNSLLMMVKQDTDSQQRCLSEVHQYLPEGFTFTGKLFFTVGYDIGVAMGENASLNLSHETFQTTPEEVWYYCVHEMHHVGFQHYNPFIDLNNIDTGAQLADLVKYLTFLEGSAVYAALAMRKADDALNEHDYIALQNPSLMQEYVAEYFDIVQKIDAIQDNALTEADWQLIDPLSDGKRLWYRVGALMCQQIDAKWGRKKLNELIQSGPDAFFSAWKTLNQSG